MNHSCDTFIYRNWKPLFIRRQCVHIILSRHSMKQCPGMRTGDQPFFPNEKYRVLSAVRVSRMSWAGRLDIIEETDVEDHIRIFFVVSSWEVTFPSCRSSYLNIK